MNDSDLAGTILLGLRMLLAMALYGFVAWGLLTLWRDLRRQKEAAVESEPAINLKIQAAAEIPVLHLQGAEILIGRDPTCGCVLPSETVSARHARLAFHHDQWWIEDLKSTNGTQLNGIPVETPMVIVPGDQLRCGDVSLSVEEHTPS